MDQPIGGHFGIPDLLWTAEVVALKEFEPFQARKLPVFLGLHVFRDGASRKALDPGKQAGSLGGAGFGKVHLHKVGHFRPGPGPRLPRKAVDREAKSHLLERAPRRKRTSGWFHILVEFDHCQAGRQAPYPLLGQRVGRALHKRRQPRRQLSHPEDNRAAEQGARGQLSFRANGPASPGAAQQLVSMHFAAHIQNRLARHIANFSSRPLKGIADQILKRAVVGTCR